MRTCCGGARRSRLSDWLPLILYLVSGPLVMKGLQILSPSPGHDTHHRHTASSSSPFTLAFALYVGFFLVLPGILAFCAGFRQKNKRRGAGAGAWYGLASLLAVGGSVLYAAATEVHGPDWSGMTVPFTALYVGVVFLLLLGTWLGYGALLGMGGAKVRQAINRRRNQWVHKVRCTFGVKQGNGFSSSSVCVKGKETPHTMPLQFEAEETVRRWFPPCRPHRP